MIKSELDKFNMVQGLSQVLNIGVITRENIYINS